MKRLFLLTLTLLLLGSGCTRLGEISVRDVKIQGFNLINTSSGFVDLQFIADNPTNRAVALEEAVGFLKKGETNFALFSLEGADTVAANRTSVNNLRVKVEVLDPLALLSMGLNISRWDQSDFSIEGRAAVRPINGRKRVIKVKKMPLEQLIKRL